MLDGGNESVWNFVNVSIYPLYIHSGLNVLSRLMNEDSRCDQLGFWFNFGLHCVCHFSSAHFCFWVV